ncbi:Hypothetical predicted protein [Cloeon dipterum]|uniref:Uncharacterized protein n=1 Tax=Cloeon dipterum TaxID=197152 RepID=A0A8S1DI36_9INSE|nr:Hypothetical predicted protein [Cloeon dipterum]
MTEIVAFSQREQTFFKPEKMDRAPCESHRIENCVICYVKKMVACAQRLPSAVIIPRKHLDADKGSDTDSDSEPEKPIQRGTTNPAKLATGPEAGSSRTLNRDKGKKNPRKRGKQDSVWFQKVNIEDEPALAEARKRYEEQGAIPKKLYRTFGASSQENAATAKNEEQPGPSYSKTDDEKLQELQAKEA